MKRLSARFLTTMSTEQLWDTLAGPFVLVFDDGELITNARETIYSSYAWEFHRKYPKTPLFKEHHVRHILGPGKRLGYTTHLKLLGNVMWEVHAAYRQDETVTTEHLAELTYQIVNTMYNELSYRCEEYVTSLDITDYIEILDHPDILAAKKDAPPTEAAVTHIQETITNVLLNDERLDHNPIARAVKSGLSNMGQVLQCVGPRGFISDIDGTYFPRPIMRGFAEGFRSFHDSFIESRHASMSLAQAKDPLEQTEYFSRRLQLICQNLRNLHMTDCGSKEYLYWTVRDKQYDDEGNVVQKSDLELLAGKYFLNSDGGLTAIKKKDKHLMGHTLKLRSVLHCQHPDPYGICATCFGELSYSILDPLTGNLGQTNCTSMTEVVSQLVLSTKHFVGGAVLEAIVLDAVMRNYLDVSPDRMSYLLHKRLKDKHVRLVIPHQFAANLTDIQEVEDVNQLTSITRISELPEIGLYEGSGEEMTPITLKVAMDRRMASMTYPFLAHIKKNGWTLNERGHYVIEMAGWDFDKPILQLPMKRYNMSDHSAEIADILESSIKELGERDKEEAVDATMVKLFDHVNHRLNVNLAVLEVVLYGGMVVSAANDNFALPKVGTGRALGVYDHTIENRSMSAKMAYEHQLASILNPHNYITPNRMDHPFDALLMPYEVLQHLEE